MSRARSWAIARRLHSELASLSAFKPSPQRRLRFAGPPPCEETFHADVFVEIRPMYTFSVTDETPTTTFIVAAIRESRVPRQRHTDRAAVDEFHGEHLVAH